MAHASNVMKSNPVTTSSGETVSAVVKRMAEGKFGSLLLVDGDQLKGIFTERDLLNKVVGAGKNPETTLIEEVATLNPITVKKDTHVKECAAILKDNGFRHLPVVDDAGKAIGIISSRDFFEHIAEEMEHIIDRLKDQGRTVEEDFDLYEEIGLPTSAI